MADINRLRIVVAGDHDTGKSTLISTFANEEFHPDTPPLLPPIHLPVDYFPDCVPITIVDTNFSMENRARLFEELKRAHAVVLTYACDRLQTLESLRNFWLPELRRLEVKVPVVLAGCKLDLRVDYAAEQLEQIMNPIMQQFVEIETCLECSAARGIQVPDVFYYAQKAVLYPTPPLFDQVSQTLTPLCVRALKRVFILCDRDMDGALSDDELSAFQVICFNIPLQPAEIDGVKRVVQQRCPQGLNDLGLTFEGFLFLHALFLEGGRLETSWAVLRRYGYNNELKLRDDYLPSPPTRAPDQSVELSTEAMEFLHQIFRMFDLDKDGALYPAEIEDIFSSAPESPWVEAPYRDAAERTSTGNLTLNGFLAEWALMTLLDQQQALANLVYLGYGSDIGPALHVNQRRSMDRKRRQTERNVFHCLVFGPRSSGKSALLSSFLGRPFAEDITQHIGDHYATNIVDQPGGTKKTLILQEIPDGDAKRFLSNKKSLAACDVAVVVYDSSDEHSWKRSKELLFEIARQGEDSSYGVPSLLIAAKEDLEPNQEAVQDSIKACQEFGMEIPIHISVKSRDLNNVYSKIVYAAEHPHLSIPETERGRTRRHKRQLVSSSLMLITVGTAVAFVGFAAYRVYATSRRNASN